MPARQGPLGFLVLIGFRTETIDWLGLVYGLIILLKNDCFL